MTQNNVHPRILVGYDSSADARAALDFAIAEAKARDGVLHVVYAVDDTVLNSAWGVVFDAEEVRRLGEEFAAEARALAEERGLPADRVQTESLLGHPAAVLARLSETAALLVLGRRSAGGSGESSFTGSTAVSLAASASCPIIILSQHSTPPDPPIGRFLVGVDSTGRSPLAVEWAFRRAARVGASLDIISGVSPTTGRLFARQPTPEQVDQALASARERLDALVGPVREQYPDVPVRVDVLVADPVEELVRRSTDADMVILGTHPTFPSYGVGGVVRGVMAHCRVPLGLLRHS